MRKARTNRYIQNKVKQIQGVEGQMTRMRKIQSSLKENLGKLDGLDFTSIVKSVLQNQSNYSPLHCSG